MTKKSFRTVQHRVESEERKKNKLLTELKHENQALRRKVSRLQKQAARPSVEEMEEPEPVIKFECVKCQSGNVVLLKTPTSKLRVCKDCCHREKEK